MSSFAVAAEVPTPATVRSPRRSVLWTLALLGVAAGVSSVAFAVTNDTIGAEIGAPLVLAALWAWTTVAYILCGMLAWWRRPASRIGPLMIVSGFVWYVVTLSWTTSDIPYTTGQAFDKLPWVALLLVFLAFPNGRLTGRSERSLVVVAFVLALGLELVRMVVGDYGPNNLLGFARHPDLFVAVRRLQLFALAVCCLVGVVVLFARRWRTGSPSRRPSGLLIDVFALGLVMVAAFCVLSALNSPALVEVRWAEVATLGIAPVVFLIAILNARLARLGVGDLIIELGSDPSPADLRKALARVLRDPSLSLVYWLPEFGTYADLDGQAVELPDESSPYATTLIDRNGEHVAALIHDQSLDDEPELLGAVTAAAGIALENGRLQAEQKAHLEELKGSRARVIEAGELERQRLERNLHDGAQQRLIALSLELSVLEKELKHDLSAGKRLDAAQREIEMSLEELRGVARGLHPAVLTGHGLAVALEQVAARAAVPVRLQVEPEARFPGPVEVAAYYVVTESLTNVAKHARATRASVEVSRTDGGLFVEVIDDGVGGADSERGTGLRGLADRVEALGGRLRIWTPQGGGTRVRAEIPCE
jgi:signal transduction histidine kinase